MIRKNQSFFNFLNRLSDAVTVYVSYYLACYLWLILKKQDVQNIALSFRQSAWIIPLFCLAMVVIYQVAGVYDALRLRKPSRDFVLIVGCNLGGMLLMGSLLYFFRGQEFSRGTYALFFLLSSGLTLTKRLCLRRILSHFRRLGYNQKHVLLLGGGGAAQAYLEAMIRSPRHGYTVDAYLSPAQTDLPLPYAGGYDAMSAFIEEHVLDEYVAALDASEMDTLPTLIQAAEKNGVNLLIYPFYNAYMTGCTTVESIGDCHLINVRSLPCDELVPGFIKRAADFTLALLGLILLLPLMLAVALGVCITAPGPVFFKQERVGKNGKPFQMYKFRSMRVNDTSETAWSTTVDDRRTAFGAFIRKCSIDELPQLWNVVKGDMSLIGPRPELPFFVQQFREEIPMYMVRHRVRPGITGWAQIHGLRGDTSIETRVKFDIWYIEHWSVWLDLRILVMTVFGGWLNQEKLTVKKDLE